MENKCNYCGQNAVILSIKNPQTPYLWAFAGYVIYSYSTVAGGFGV